MEAITAAHASLEKKGNLSKAVTSVQQLIDQLQSTRDAVASSPDLTAMHIAKLKNPVKQTFDKIDDDLKDVYKGLNQYSKALKDKFKSSNLPTAANDVLGAQPELIDRAIAMHLLREGKFGVASTFVQEVNARMDATPQDGDGESVSRAAWIKDFADSNAMDEQEREEGELLGRGHLQRRFSEMYHILDALRNQHNLSSAIGWAREHSAELEARGSNLEFELSRLKFVELYTAQDNTSDGPFAGPTRALAYARSTFPAFSARYSREISGLLGALAFSPAICDSPYKRFFCNQGAWEDVSISFTREFCSFLGLSPQSPLYTAVTAGGIALPVLEKVERVMAQARGQWTSVNELPVETPLPQGFQFHSIFVCPVSKEQATDANPPMMMTCGHVIAKESLEMHSKGKSRMKCPYCPNESHPREAKRVYI